MEPEINIHNNRPTIEVNLSAIASRLKTRKEVDYFLQSIGKLLFIL